MSGNRIDGPVHVLNEVKAKARALAFMPVGRREELRSRLEVEGKVHSSASPDACESLRSYRLPVHELSASVGDLAHPHSHLGEPCGLDLGRRVMRIVEAGDQIAGEARSVGTGELKGLIEEILRGRHA